MNKGNVVFEKAILFAVRVTKAYNYLKDTKKEYRMSDQMYRCGTSVQANISEAQYAQSKADFISKMQIALKEANECRSWINVIYQSGYFDEPSYQSIYNDINEIVIILISIVRSSKNTQSPT